MGSGLILLVIVGAWLAVLVPLGLRSTSGPSAGVPAPEPGRVLSRRTRPVARVVEPVAPVMVAPVVADPVLADWVVAAPVTAPPVVDEPVPVRSAAPRVAAPRLAAPRVPASRVSVPHTAAPVRRRRRLLGLLALLAPTALVAGLVGPRVLLPVAGALAGLLLLALVHLRRACARRARLRAVQRRREALIRAAAARAAAEDLALERERAERGQQERLVEAARAAFVGAVDGIPSRMPPRSSPSVRRPEVVAGEVVGEEVVAQGGSPWQPVAVPLPMYVRQRAAQTAPARPRQAPPEQAPAAEELPLEHRWVSGGW